MGLRPVFVALGALWLLALPAWGATCQSARHDGNRYTWCDIDPSETPVRLFLRDQDQEIYGDFGALPDSVIIAMNGGMYHDDRRPVGHYIEDGQQIMRLIPNAGPGNFGLLPNGVLCLVDDRALVVETLTYRDQDLACDHATQSGPMLLIDGAVHPRFLPDSTSRKRRNAVGTSADGDRLVLAITDNPVTFYEFALFFRDFVGVPDALFLDGSISRFYAPQIGRNDGGVRMGPILAVTN